MRSSMRSTASISICRRRRNRSGGRSMGASEMTIPSRADVVIIGGGIIGCSLAYHLTRIGIKDVLLLEQHKLSSGTTWHSVGSVGQLRSSRLATELATYTLNLLKTLEAETGQPTGLKQPGSIML